MDKVQYRVKRGAIQLPRRIVDGKKSVRSATDFLHQGDILPEGIFPPADIKSYLADGRIEQVGLSEDAAKKAAEAITQRSKWAVDPSSLVGKSLEELLVMVLEIDENFDSDELKSEADAVRLLTSGWDPKYAQTVAQADDRTEVKSLKLDQGNKPGLAVPQTGFSEQGMSHDAEAALARAKERAAGGIPSESAS